MKIGGLLFKERRKYRVTRECEGITFTLKFCPALSPKHGSEELSVILEFTSGFKEM